MDFWSIYIFSFNKDFLEIKIEPNKTLEELRKKVADSLKIDKNILILCGKEDYDYKFNQKKLKEINGIYDGVTLHAVWSVGGGGPVGVDMADISNKEGLVKGNYSSWAFDWNHVVKGLNVRGKCKDESCVAYNLEVICKIGLGTFDLVKQADEIKCPMCNNEIELSTCIFSECEYTLDGKKRTKDENGKVKTEYINTDWQKVEKDFEYYDPLISGIVTWIMLVIETKSL